MVAEVYVNDGRVSQRAVVGLTVTVGRTNVRAQGEASYCAATLRVYDRADIVSPFDRLTVVTDGITRFVGTVAETDLRHDDAGRAYQRINAVGALARWGAVAVGEPPWPVETVAERAQRIADVIGQTIVVEGGGSQTVVSLDVDNQPGSKLLQDLATGTGGWLYDYRGEVRLQALDARKVVVSAETWNLEPVASPWTDLDTGLTWADDSAPAFVPITLTAAEVRTGPQWVATHEIANRVTVAYGDPEAAVTVEDSNSQSLYGLAPITIGTQLADPADALELAGLALSRNATPRPQLSSVTVDAADTPTGAWLAVLDARPGTRVTVTGLWSPAPAQAFLGVLEGWTETYTGGSGHSIELSLSDVRMSLAVPTWSELDPVSLWDDEPAGENWESELV